MRRVVITGIGLTSPCGGTLAGLGESVLSGRSAASEVKSFDARAFPTRIAAQVPEEERSLCETDEAAAPFVAVEDWKSAFGVLAARRALEDAVWAKGGYPPERVAVVLGTGLSSVVGPELEEDLVPFVGEGRLDLVRYGATLAGRTGRYSPARHLTDSVNRTICRLSGATGASASHFGACAASTQAIGDAFRRVRNGHADAALCGGMDSMVHPFGMISFMLLGALSTWNEFPSEACKPFHKARDGFLMGEGAAIFLLEELERARARGAKILAEIAGYGSSADGYNVTAPRPDGAGAAAAMRAALFDARLDPGSIGWINAHGTATQLNDPAEARGVRAVFGERSPHLPISSLKPVFGHCIAAAGAMEMAATLAAFASDRIPPTPNLTEATVDPEASGLDHVLGTARSGCPEIVMSNNYGFGGQNASLIFRRLR